MGNIQRRLHIPVSDIVFAVKESNWEFVVDDDHKAAMLRRLYGRPIQFETDVGLIHVATVTAARIEDHEVVIDAKSTLKGDSTFNAADEFSADVHITFNNPGDTLLTVDLIDLRVMISSKSYNTTQ